MPLYVPELEISDYRICTSSTRPSSPYEGLKIYETDTSKINVWDGTAWVELETVGTWNAFTPTWISSGTAPAIGNGTINGRYARHGQTIHVQIGMQLGSTSTVGTGNYRWSLGVNARSPVISNAHLGVGRYTDASVPDIYLTGIYQEDVDRIGAYYIGTNSKLSLLSATAPVVPASGDIYYFAFTYEASG